MDKILDCWLDGRVIGRLKELLDGYFQTFDEINLIFPATELDSAAVTLEWANVDIRSKGQAYRQMLEHRPLGL